LMRPLPADQHGRDPQRRNVRRSTPMALPELVEPTAADRVAFRHRAQEQMPIYGKSDAATGTGSILPVHQNWRDVVGVALARASPVIVIRSRRFSRALWHAMASGRILPRGRTAGPGERSRL
jgi:hypothetical protein